MSSYVIVLRISNLPLSRNGLLEFGIVPTVWYLLFLFLFYYCKKGVWAHKTSFNPATIYWSVHTKSEKIVYLCVRGIYFSLSLYDFSNEVWNCSDSVVFFFHLISESLCLYKVVTVIWIMCRFLDWGYKWKVSLLFRNMENNIMFKGHSLFIIFSSTCHPPSTHTNIKKKKKKEEKKKDG